MIMDYLVSLFETQYCLVTAMGDVANIDLKLF
jgi:hypothetical protein